MNRKKKIYFKFALLFFISIIFLSSCAVPYKILPDYWQEEQQINTIAFYPLIYTKEGNEQRLFGLFFSEMFYNSILSSEMIRSIDFVLPDSALTILELPKESNLKKLTIADFKKVSDRFDAIIYCDLLNYNEVDAGEEMVQMCLSSLLTLGNATYSENNFVKMEISLVSTKTGNSIWQYTPYFTTSLSSKENTRKTFSTNIISGFNKYFPLSKGFERKQ